jgi:hypothetical protein
MVALATVPLLEACGGTLGGGPAPATTGIDEDAADDGSVPFVLDASGSADDAAAQCDGDWILPDANGFVAASSNASGITGRWSMYTDCDDGALLEAGPPVPGQSCSLVTSPASGETFAPDPATSAICTAGTTVQVQSDDEWTTRWGAYASLGLESAGDAALDFDARAAGLRGFCLYVSGEQVPTFRVRLVSDQGFSDRNWYQATLQHEGWHRVLFDDLAQVTPTGIAFDPSRVVAIEVEIPASRVEAIPWDFCIEGLVALR